MRIFDESKTQELEELDIDFEKGCLKEDKLFIQHHEAVQAVEEQGHYETIKEYPNGGKDVEWIVDIEKVEPKEAWDEYEDIQVFVPFTEEELEKRNAEKYPTLVEKYIRERYSLRDELAILRQRDTKPEEINEYNTYAEECKVRAKTEVAKL